jgi:hypothetical protein
MLHLFGIECYPASLETGSESLFTPPGTAADSRFAKTKKYKSPRKTLPEAFRGLMPPFLIACAIL